MIETTQKENILIHCYNVILKILEKNHKKEIIT